MLLLRLAGRDDVVFGIELVPFTLVSLELIFPRHLGLASSAAVQTHRTENRARVSTKT